MHTFGKNGMCRLQRRFVELPMKLYFGYGVIATDNLSYRVCFIGYDGSFSYFKERFILTPFIVRLWGLNLWITKSRASSLHTTFARLATNVCAVIIYVCHLVGSTNRVFLWFLGFNPLISFSLFLVWVQCKTDFPELNIFLSWFCYILCILTLVFLRQS